MTESPRSTLSWAAVLDHWDAIEADFAETYHLDLTDEIHRRTWRWLRTRITGLMGKETRLTRALTPPPPA